MNLSKTTQDLLLNADANSTWKHYKCYFSKYETFCKENNFNVWNPTISTVLSFLTSLYEINLSYRTINVARSALSLCLCKIDGFSVGSHPMVCKLLTGIAKQKPPNSKYAVIWKPSVVLELFKEWGDNKSLSLALLSMKLCGLLALVTGQRVQTLCAIDVRNIVFGDQVQIRITQWLKTSKPDKPTLCIVLDRYPFDKNLCVVECLAEYLRRTLVIRRESQLLLSYSKPYGKVTTQTVSRWMSVLLSKAGVNVDQFTSHSFRHSSTSAAFRAGVSIDSIFKAADWSSNSRIFAKHYCKPVIAHDAFASAVLSS